eukprot:747732_1
MSDQNQAQDQEIDSPKYSHVAAESSAPASSPTSAIPVVSSSPTTLIGRIENYFELRQRGSSWMIELRAGCVTFVTMAYILAVNASIISETGGTCQLPSEGATDSDFFECKEIVRLDLITATAVGALIACFVMGLSANMPIGMAPGMGINAYFTYSVVGPWFEPGKVTFEMGLFAVFIEGWIFIILALTGGREIIAKLIPTYLKSAITTGIGLFLALIGLQADEGIGLVVSDAATNLTLGGCGHDKEIDLSCNEFGLECGCPPGSVLEGATTWLGIVGFLIMTICYINRIRGGIIIGILFVSFVSWFRNTKVTYFPDTAAGNIRYEYFKKGVNWHSIEKTGGALFDTSNWSEFNGQLIVALVTMLYVDILDTTGTLYSMAAFSGQIKDVDNKDIGCCSDTANFKKSKQAFCSDAIGTVIGSMLGTTDVTAYIESAAGINEGGKTGITAIVIGIWFFFSLFFSPIFASIPPWATGPALVLVGALMMDDITKVDWKNFRQSIPAFLTMIIMPFTYSIAYGIIAGLGTHAVINIIDFMVYSCKKMWHYVQIKRGKSE